MTEKMFRSQEGKTAILWQENTMIPLVLPQMNIWTLKRVTRLEKREYLGNRRNIDKVSASNLRLIHKDVNHHYSLFPTPGSSWGLRKQFKMVHGGVAPSKDSPGVIFLVQNRSYSIDILAINY